MKETDDTLLVRQCLEGKSEAFEAIVDRYQNVIFNLALRMSNDSDDAEDIAQTVFIKAYEGLVSFNPRYKFFSWLYRIAINESLNYASLRRQHETLDESVISNDKPADEKYCDFELSHTIQNALMELALDYRIILVLKHFQDLSYSEIAYVLEIPEKTVKSRLFTARQSLRTILIRERI